MRRTNNFFAQFVSRTATTLALLVAVCLCALAQATNPQSPVAATEGKKAQAFKLAAVVLNEKSNFVENLRAEDFILTENGVPQATTFFAREDLPLSYTLLVDNTGSLRTMIDHVLKTGEAVVAGMRPQDEMSVVRFVSRNNIELLQNFTQNKNLLVEAIEQMYTEGGETAMLEALYVSAEALAARTPGATRHRAIVLVTDGGERETRSSLDELLNLLRRQHIHVFVFGLTEAVEGGAFDQVKGGRKKSRALLETLARESGGRAVFPKKPAEFADAAAALNRQLQMPEYVLGYTPNSTTNTGKPSAVQLKLANSVVSSRGKLQLHTNFQ
jgi:Ca-activated chloride channel family protein